MGSLSFIRTICPLLILVWLNGCAATKMSEKEPWWIHPEFSKMQPVVIGVMPIENLTLEPGVEQFLFEAVYNRLSMKGYRKISVDHTREVMSHFGIQVPGQLVGISNQKLQEQLHCDAILLGRIDQSSAIHGGVYDAVVVSLSLMLRDLQSGKVLWQTEQWRTAHRQWQLDPFNILINFGVHENASRELRIQWLVQEMLETLPDGPVRIEKDVLLKQAQEVKAYGQ